MREKRSGKPPDVNSVLRKVSKPLWKFGQHAFVDFPIWKRKSEQIVLPNFTNFFRHPTELNSGNSFHSDKHVNSNPFLTQPYHSSKMTQNKCIVTIDWQMTPECDDQKNSVCCTQKGTWSGWKVLYKFQDPNQVTTYPLPCLPACLPTDPLRSHAERKARNDVKVFGQSKIGEPEEWPEVTKDDDDQHSQSCTVLPLPPVATLCGRQWWQQSRQVFVWFPIAWWLNEDRKAHTHTHTHTHTSEWANKAGGNRLGLPRANFDRRANSWPVRGGRALSTPLFTSLPLLLSQLVASWSSAVEKKIRWLWPSIINATGRPEANISFWSVAEQKTFNQLTIDSRRKVFYLFHRQQSSKKSFFHFQNQPSLPATRVFCSATCWFRVSTLFLALNPLPQLSSCSSKQSK